MQAVARAVVALALATLAFGTAAQSRPSKPVRIISQADVKERVDVAGSTPEDLARFQRAEMEKWARIVRDSGAKVD